MYPGTWLSIIPFALFLIISGCGERHLERPDPEAGIQERIEFYLARLGDRDYVQYYELEGTKVPWYLAAEELGGLGSPAIPPLIERVQATNDPYERKLCFYALRLAAQSPEVIASIGRTLPDDDLALPPEGDQPRVLSLWLDWWETYGDSVQHVARATLTKE
jgi:hypothetical protein